jgi:hypothetical protein
MNIEKLTQKIVEAVKERETYNCESAEHDEKDNVVNELISQIPQDDIKEFNKLYNQPENWL